MYTGLDSDTDGTVSFAGVDAVGGKVDPNLAMAAQSGHIGMRYKKQAQKDRERAIERILEHALDGHIWAQQLMVSLNNSGWVLLIRALRDDDREIIGEPDIYDWLEVADEYGIPLTDKDLAFLTDEYPKNPYLHNRQLEATNE